MDLKTPMHMRLTGTARRLLTELAKRKGISQTAVVELAVRMMAASEGISLDVKEEGDGDHG